MKVLYFDCFSGMSGDMTIGAFLDAGMDMNYLVNELSKLNLAGYSLKSEAVMKNGLAARKFNVMDEKGNVFGHAPIFLHCHKRHSHGNMPPGGHKHDDHDHHHGHDNGHPHPPRPEDAGGPHLHPDGDHSHEHGILPEFHHEHYEKHDHGHNVKPGEHCPPFDSEELREHFDFHSHEEGHEHSHHHCPPPPPPPAAHHRYDKNEGQKHQNKQAGHDHGHDRPEHDHGHSHDHGANDNGQHRGLNEIKKLINDSSLNARVKSLSCEIFQNIAEVESKMHNIAIDKIHFHEVGAIDSIIDIVGTAICVDHFNIEECFVSKVPVSFGYIKFSHGLWPNPAPATLELLKNFTLYKMNIDRELITPTGAAILKTLCKGSSQMPDIELEKIGYGAGYHDFEHPNVLRIMIGEKKKGEITRQSDIYINSIAEKIGCGSDQIDMITANIDDMRPEYYDFLIEKLMSIGALDAIISPVIMKKGRPSNQLNVMCQPEKTATLSAEIFKLSTTIGMRVQRTGRLVLDRRTDTLKTDHGDVRFKVTFLKGIVLNVKPEYDDLKKYANAKNISPDAAALELSEKFKLTL